MGSGSTTRVAFTAQVTGRVQGVGFRYYTQNTARRLGVYGYVRNLPDGSVEVVCEGPHQAVGRMAEWLKTGPPSAHVLQATFRWRNVRAGYPSFTVEYD